MSNDRHGRRPLGRSDEDRAFLEGGARALTSGPRSPQRSTSDRMEEERSAIAEELRRRLGQDRYAEDDNPGESYQEDRYSDEPFHEDRFAGQRPDPDRFRQRAPVRPPRDPYDESQYREEPDDRLDRRHPAVGRDPRAPHREPAGHQARRPAQPQPDAGTIPGRSAPRRPIAGRPPAGPAGRAPRPTRPRAQDGEDPERLYESFNDLYEDFDEGRSKTPFVIIGALLAVAVVGGGLAFAYKRSGGESDGPPVILADRTATKVEPVDPGGIEIPHQDRQIFDQVAGQGAGESEPQLAESEPVDLEPQPVPDAAATAPQGEQAPFTIGALANRANDGAVDIGTSVEAPSPTPPAIQGGESGVLQPKRVRTVSITADGRVISEPQGEGAAIESSRVVDSTPGNTSLARIPIVDGNGAIQPDGLAPAPQAGAQQTPSLIQPGGQQPDALTVARGLSTTETLAQPPTAQVPGQQSQTTLFAPSPRPKPRPTSQALQQQSALQPTAAARPQITQPQSAAPAPTALEGFAVQVASHRSQAEAVARFADLQQRFPDLMSGYQPLIQRADLGERGIFFRLRIGPFDTRADANRLCSSLKSAGLPGCFVRNL